METGRVLGLDYGRARVGAAISDPGRRFASPLETYHLRDPSADALHYRSLCHAENINRIVVGLPVHTTGRDSAMAEEARDFAAWLRLVTGCPVDFQDERYTSAEAEEILRANKVKPSRRQALRDQLAAQILLQAFLDAGCPPGEPTLTSLDDPPDKPERTS